MAKHTSRHLPVNKCIYCYKTDGRLTDEHIIPLSLKGREVLPKASCDACADITKRFENTISRKTYIALRAQFKFPTRRPKERPQNLPLFKISPSGELTQFMVPIEVHPSTVIFPFVPKPRILEGEAKQDHLEIDLKIFPLKIPNAATAVDESIYKEAFVENEFHYDHFCRLVAKVCHCFAVAVLGFDGWTPFLNAIILGGEEDFGYYIGASDVSAESQNSRLSLRLRAGSSGLIYLCVDFVLLDSKNSPVYRAVVGLENDPRLIRLAVNKYNNKAQQGRHFQ